MAEGWKQVWEDILNALRGVPSEAESPVQTENVEAELVASEIQATNAFDSRDVDSPVDQKLTDEASVPPMMLESEGEIETYVDHPPEPKLSPRQNWMSRLRTGVFNLLMAVVFLGSLWFAGGYQWAPDVYLWWLRLTAPKPPASDVIATFDGGQFTIADVESHLKLLAPEEYESIAGSPETLLAVVEDMVTDELTKRWAITRQPDQDDTFSHTMQHISESLNLESLHTQLHESEIPVSESDIQAYFETNKSQFGDQTLDQVREQIRQTLVAEREQGYVEDYVQRLKDNASISRNYELLSVPAASEDDLRRYYEANLENFKLPLQALVDEMQFAVGSDEEAARKNADDSLLKIRSGATFDEVAQTIPPTSLQSSALIPEGTRDPAWDAAVFALTEGELSDVFRAGDAFYIVRLNQLETARTQSLDEVRSEVLDVVQPQIMDAWFEANASKTLLTLKGRQYTLSQFYQEYKELPVSTQAQYAGSDGMKNLAELLIERLLLVEDTYDQLLDVQNQPLADESRLQILKQMMHQEEVDDKIQVTDEEMQKYYDENLDLMSLPPKARIRYIRVGLGQTDDEQNAARARADEAYKKLVPGLFQEGASFAEVAQEYSEDPESAAQGGEFPDWIGESDDILTEVQIHPFHEVVLSLPTDEISQPFELGDSLYIVQVIERTGPEQMPFEEAKPYIEEILTQQKHDEQLEQIQQALVAEANIVVYPTVLENYFQQLQTPVPINPSP